MNRKCFTLAITLALLLWAGVVSTSILFHPAPALGSIALTADNPNPPASPVKLIFIHHSCGENWLNDGDGGLGIALRNNNYFVSDTNYGWGPDSIGDTTDIGHWWNWFRGTNSATYLSALYAESGQHSSYSRLSSDPGGENEVIMFKSCFPNSDLGGNPGDPPTTGSNPLRGQDAWSEYMTVGNAKGIYNDILEYFETRQDKLFVVITAPPVQDDTYANNARAFNTWLVEDWLDGYAHNNVAVFDFYNVLTSNGGNWYTNDLGWDTGNHHRYRNGTIEYITDEGGNTAAYPNGGSDDHPSQAGNQKATDEFVPLLNIFYHRWKGDEVTPTPTATGPPSTSTPTVTATATGTVPPSTATATASPTPTQTGTPPIGQQTIVFQQGDSPDPSYTGTADATITTWSGNSYANLGGLDYLQVGEVGDADEFRLLVRFEVDGWLPANIQVNEAWLELRAYDSGYDDRPHDVVAHFLIEEWVEGDGWDLEADSRGEGVTWATARPGVNWAAPGGDFDPAELDRVTVAANPAGWYRWDMTSAVRAWVNETAPNYGLLLEPDNGLWLHHQFRSSEYSAPNLRPRLVVTYTVGDTATPTSTPTSPPTPTRTGPPPAYHFVYLPLILKNWSAPVPTPTATPTTVISSQLIQPADLVYEGAFRLPDGPPEIGWEWSGAAIAYYPDGDPSGPADGYPGSIFGTGHNWNQYVSEISIPVPVNSPGKNVNDLNTAATLQDFHNIRGDLFGEFEIPRAGLEYLPAQGTQTTGKLYFCWAQHMGEGDTNPSHGWCELDLSNPQTAGAWRIGSYWNYVTTDYIFAIPPAWADAYTPGMYLATGRFRDGGQGAQGPSIFAYGPWNEGNPPATGSTLPAVPLLLYGNAYAPGSPTMNDYHHSDEWAGGAWLTAGNKSAVIFVGTKGTGDCWYGCSDGTVWPDEPPFPPECPERGWWSTGFEGQILFYDPANLVAVARGEMETWEPQPYATLDIDQHLYRIESSQQKHHLGAASFDRQRGLLYVFEPLADEDKSLIHVWRIAG